jgi:NAD(P)-dependent dehydrogenase (short-subunit alcohol dehydrogenase family)
MPDTVLITGVSTGIGAAAARIAAAHGAHVFGSVRNLKSAAALQQQLGDRFTPLVFDVRDEAGVAAAAAIVRAALGGKRLGGLVNNAGVALAGPLALQPIAEFREQLEVNVVGPMIVTQAFLPLLGTDPALTGPPGRIVNVSSVAGQMSAPFVGAYAAAKHALEGLSGSLRRELMLFGIDVILVAPGAVVTPIWDKAEEMPVAAYENTPWVEPLRRFRAYFLKTGRQGYPPEKVGEVIWQALSTAKPAARYAVVKNALANWTIPRRLPARVVDRIISKQVGLRQEQK